MHVVPGIVVVAVVGLALLNGRYDPVADPTLWWLAPSVLDIAFHVWQVLRGGSRPGGPRNLVENLERSVGEIDPVVAARILRMRNRAISRLQERSKIDDATARLALGTGLGALALTMAPELRSGAAPRQPLRRSA